MSSRMIPEHEKQAARYQEHIHRAYGGQYNLAGTESNPGEGSSANDNSNGPSYEDDQKTYEEPVQDPNIPKGIYSPSGIDVLSILLAVRRRPNPEYDLGPIDDRAALVLCDPTLPDMPISYCSETFLNMVGYQEHEVMGRNCRFLQHRPHSKAKKLDSDQQKLNEDAKREIRQRVAWGREAQVKVVNYKSNGEKFENVLTIVPVVHGGIHYIVGFQFNFTEAYWLK